MVPDAHGLTVLPFFAGERSPAWRPDARAALAGLSLATTPLDMLRAAIESVALRLAAVHEDLLDTLADASDREWEILAGGAALRNSDLWLQIITDALGVPVTRSAVEESSARGAALLAWQALGLQSIDAFEVPRAKRHLPVSANTAAYAAARQRQSRLYAALPAL
jgi:gluconokinase